MLGSALVVRPFFTSEVPNILLYNDNAAGSTERARIRRVNRYPQNTLTNLLCVITAQPGYRCDYLLGLSGSKCVGWSTGVASVKRS